ncbi:MAG: UrcA family protein [Gammaproteobacteria bacterium]|nr:UrcA family protein [Gammaproteobacteria bacterium]
MKTSKAMHHSHRWLTAPALLFCSLVAGQALADPSDIPPTVTVSFADLDLSKPEGAATLYGRLHQAAKQVCGTQGRRLDEIVQWKACYASAIGEAVKMVDQPSLTAHHQARQGTRAEPAEPTVAKSQ